MTKTSEFGFIQHISSLFEQIGNKNIEGIGDDCAVFAISEDESLVFTTDLLTEDVHFLRGAISPFELGHKSLAVNLSDVAAMGAKPEATLLSIALPENLEQGWAESFMDGYKALSARYNVALIGGDTSSSVDKITINVVAIGRVSRANIKRRKDARVGDVIFVVGSLGESAAGLDDVLVGRVDTPLAKCHHRPQAQVLEGQWLGDKQEVGAMIDLSDGLASDLVHILKLSGVDAEVDLDKISAPCGIEKAVCGGEDYKLLFTLRQGGKDLDNENLEQFIKKFEAQFKGQRLYQIGSIVEREGSEAKIGWLQNGEKVEKRWKGFTHF